MAVLQMCLLERGLCACVLRGARPNARMVRLRRLLAVFYAALMTCRELSSSRLLRFILHWRISSVERSCKRGQA